MPRPISDRLRRSGNLWKASAFDFSLWNPLEGYAERIAAAELFENLLRSFPVQPELVFKAATACTESMRYRRGLAGVNRKPCSRHGCVGLELGPSGDGAVGIAGTKTHLRQFGYRVVPIRVLSGDSRSEGISTAFDGIDRAHKLPRIF